MHRFAIVLAASAICTPLLGQVVEIPLQRVERHSAWRSALAGSDAKSGRATTAVANGNTLILDFYPRDGCGTPAVTVAVSLDSEAERPSVERITGSLRIDQEALIAFSGEYSIGLGDRLAWLTVESVSNPRVFMAQIITGKNVRIQVGDTRSSRVERWSLSGSDAAIYRAMQLCNSL